MPPGFFGCLCCLLNASLAVPFEVLGAAGVVHDSAKGMRQTCDGRGARSGSALFKLVSGKAALLGDTVVLGIYLPPVAGTRPGPCRTFLVKSRLISLTFNPGGPVASVLVCVRLPAACRRIRESWEVRGSECRVGEAQRRGGSDLCGCGS